MSGALRRIKSAAKAWMHRGFRLGQRCGFDLLPRHFYSSIPDLRELQEHPGWRKPCSMVGVAGADLQSQMQFARSCCTPQSLSRVARGDVYPSACQQNGQAGFGPIEANFLFCFIQSQRPQKIIQVGSGVSTAVILHAASECAYKPQLTCIDPFPTRFLENVASDGRARLIPQRAQEVASEVLTDTGPDGLLFIDSTHTVKVGSEVNRLILDVLPILPAGAFVHFHDIYFPFDYPPNLFHTNFFWSESTLLHAFLIFNTRFVIRVSLSMLHHGCPEALRELFAEYRPAIGGNGLLAHGSQGDFPSSTYLQVVG